MWIVLSYPLLLLFAEQDVIPETVDSMEQMLQASCCCYQKALALESHDQQKSNLQRRLGSIHNELGVLYMNLAAGNIILTEHSGAWLVFERIQICILV
jgi:hypothetical protein